MTKTAICEIFESRVEALNSVLSMAVNRGIFSRLALPRSWSSQLPIPTDSKRILCLGLLAALVVLGCSRLPRLPTLSFEPPFGRSNWIEFRDARVLDSPTPALTVTISNRKNIPLWIRMEIDELGGEDDCMNVFKLEAESSRAYVCAQTFLSVGKRFRVQAVVYKDVGNTKTVESINRLIELQRDADGELELVGRAAD